jgi:hypothetical protein
MSENRAILESVFLKNRNAINDLNSVDASRTHGHSVSTSSENKPEFSPGAHGRNLSHATGVETLSVTDVLPAIDHKQELLSTKDGLARRFSKRVGLNVHKSIMEIKANDAEATLKNRWIKMDMAKPMPPIAEASSIASAPLQTLQQESKSNEESAGSRPLEPSSDLVSFTSIIGKSLGRAVRGLSLADKRSGQRKDASKDDVADSIKNEKEDRTVTTDGERGPMAALKRKLSRPALTASDYDQEFENGV